MKALYFLIVCFCITTIVSCTPTLKTIENGKKIDQRLVGTWIGSEKDKQMEGVEKHWEMTRRDDGSFSLKFTVHMDGETETITETGNWWVDKNTFFEKHDVSGKTDTYKYKVLNNDHVKFSSINISVDTNTDKYEFIDTRK